MIDLYVAVFDCPQFEIQDHLTEAARSCPAISNGLSNLSVFTRLTENTVELAMAYHSEALKIELKPVRTIDIGLLKRFLPKPASWRVVASSSAFQMPETVLNKRFASFLEVMVPAGSASVFFIPRQPADGANFAQALSEQATVLRTEMSLADVETLRGSLKATS